MPEKDDKVRRLEMARDAVVPFFQPMKVLDGDWLKSQKEAGETFEEYIASNPTLPTNERRTIYIQPIGNFTPEQEKAIGLVADYMQAFYNLPVKLKKGKPLGRVPADKQRFVDRDNSNRQIRTSYFLDDVLPKLLPDDAAAFIAFTNYDLYPGDTWYFVFGQASFEQRVGVWSLYRFADPRTRKYEPRSLITRTLKVALHEVGHMFSMKHCTKYECLMSGTNHVLETDRRPLDNCPECMAKVAWAMDYDPKERYEKLAAFWQRQGSDWAAEEIHMREKARAVSDARK
ncbi:MAG: archaemetzincin [Pyrinomonadaceae bacterium]|nr:archaemetzincin [Pyrinomonadaceae bacterium]